MKLTPTQAAADDKRWAPCSRSEASHRTQVLSLLVWKPALEILPRLEKKLTSMSSTAGRLLSVDVSVSGNSISNFMGKSLSVDESSSTYNHYILIARAWAQSSFVSGPGGWAVTLRGKLFACFLVCLFWKKLLHLIYHEARREKKRTNRNNHTLPQTAPPAFCFPSLVTHMLAPQHIQ